MTSGKVVSPILTQRYSRVPVNQRVDLRSPFSYSERNLKRAHIRRDRSVSCVAESFHLRDRSRSMIRGTHGVSFAKLVQKKKTLIFPMR